MKEDIIEGVVHTWVSRDGLFRNRTISVVSDEGSLEFHIVNHQLLGCTSLMISFKRKLLTEIPLDPWYHYPDFEVQDLGTTLRCTS